MKRFDLSLYLVLDPVLCADIGMVKTARLAVAGGVTMVQLRDKQAGTASLIATGRALQQVLLPAGVPLVVNDDVEAAVVLGADLHIGQDDITPAEARKAVGPDRVLGLSVETEELAAAVDPSIVDYAGIGPVFATPTKPDHKQPLGLEGLARVISRCPVPSVAIGGLKVQHVEDVFRARADGIAVVSAICGMADPQASAAELCAAIERMGR